MIVDILQDASLAALAAIGFAAAGRPPRTLYPACALIAAMGHALRFCLMNPDWGAGIHIVIATFIASLTIGVIAVLLSPLIKIPAEASLFPSLLPMIPGIYAYKGFGALVLCVLADTQEAFQRSCFLFVTNAGTCLFILLCMVSGAILPIFLFEKISFQATRPNKFL